MVWRPQFQIEGLSKMEVKEVFEKKSWTTELRQKDRYVTDSITFDITLGCPMSFTSFPFDQQICNLEVVSAVPKMKLENLKVDIKERCRISIYRCKEIHKGASKTFVPHQSN